jgi:hypothetical protein
MVLVTRAKLKIVLFWHVKCSSYYKSNVWPTCCQMVNKFGYKHRITSYISKMFNI